MDQRPTSHTGEIPLQGKNANTFSRCSSVKGDAAYAEMKRNTCSGPVSSALPMRTYKSKGNFMDATSRRMRFLESQKKRRMKFLDDTRNAIATHMSDCFPAYAVKPYVHGIIAAQDETRAPYAEFQECPASTQESQNTEGMAIDESFVYCTWDEDVEQYSQLAPKHPETQESGEEFPNGHGKHITPNAMMNSTVGGREATNYPKRKEHTIYGKRLIVYDWLVDLPTDMARNWLFYVRPEGKRCLIFIFNNYAIARDKFGAKFKVFECALPHTGLTVLESTYYQPLNVFYISDVLVWNDCLLSDSSLECRYFFLKSRYDEVKDLISEANEMNETAFRIVDYQECSPWLLRDSYYSQTDFSTDCIVFVHKEAHYIPGFNPLWLCWRDAHLSRYNVDTVKRTRNENGNGKQYICLELTPNGNLKTADDVVVGRVESEDLMGPLKRRKGLVRCEISGVDLESRALLDLRVVCRAHRSRIYAEPLNRIILQAIQRMDVPALTFEDIVKAVEKGNV